MICLPSLKVEIWLVKKGCSPFKLILHQFSTAISPLTKFHQNRMKNTLVENFCQSVDFNRLSRKVKKMAAATFKGTFKGNFPFRGS